MRLHSVNHPMLLMEEQYIYIYIYNCIWLEVEKIEVLVELSTYLFVCVLRRSFTSISKISFWLKLDFNLSANAFMLLKNPPTLTWLHNSGHWIRLLFTLGIILQVCLQLFVFSTFQGLCHYPQPESLRSGHLASVRSP